MIRNRTLCYKLDRILPPTTLQGSVNGSLSQVAEAARGVPQGSVLVLLNTGFCADNNDARATKKTWNAFLPRAILRDPDPRHFSSPCTKRLFAYIFYMQYKHLPPFSPGIARR